MYYSQYLSDLNIGLRGLFERVFIQLFDKYGILEMWVTLTHCNIKAVTHVAGRGQIAENQTKE